MNAESSPARFQELDAEYEILGELGRGGTAIVYRARERELGREVAIKVVRGTHVDDVEAAARLAREAKLVAALRHPNIVPLLSVRHLSDGLALVMQHVPGRTLKRAIRECGPLPVPLVEQVLREVAAALDYSHKRHGVVHRDIKPENIYLDEEVGRALLADFGIARTEGDSTLTLVGTALGTPAYMSPEQIDGTALDGRSDLYSLGLVAYEMLTGQQPWAGHNLYTIIYKQKHEDLPPISDTRKDVPVYLLRAVETLLRKEAAERCPDAAQLLAQLPTSGAAPLDFTMTAAAPPEPEGAGADDSPTLRYQRPAELVVMTPPAPAEAQPHPEPALAAAAAATLVEPAVAAPAAIIKLVEQTPEAPPAVATVLELPTVRPNWRRAPSARGRGGLSAAGAFAQPVATVTAVGESEEIAAPVVNNRKARLVAGLTLFLVLGGSGAVVATMGGGDEPPANGVEQQLEPTQRQWPADALVKSSALEVAHAAAPASSPAQSNPTNSGSATTAETAKDQPGNEQAAQPEIKLPNVVMPDIAMASTNPSVTAGDFASAAPVPEARPESIASGPGFAPRTVEPSLKNMTQVRRALRDNYPMTMRERGISGTVNLWVYVDSDGHVRGSQVHRSSGYEALDSAAVRVVKVMQFSPAMNRDKKVGVWIQLPIQFKAQ